MRMAVPCGEAVPEAGLTKVIHALFCSTAAEKGRAPPPPLLRKIKDPWVLAGLETLAANVSRSIEDSSLAATGLTERVTVTSTGATLALPGIVIRTRAV